VRTYGSGANWLQPRWEYMHHHAFIRAVDLRRIGVWEEDGGQVVGVVHPEHQPGTVYLQTDPAHAGLELEMLRYAEANLAAKSAVRVFIHDSDPEFQRAAAERGYEKDGGSEAMSRLDISEPLGGPALPAGFRISSLAEDDDPEKVHRLLWRGFNHEGEPPPDGRADRALMQSAPNFRKDLNIVILAPDGRFASYCGMWYEPHRRIACVEPVATDPDFRQLGLAGAAVLEGIRRCEREGATCAYVATAMPFYLSLGFRRVYGLSAWRRET
jgi:GNAT superfamily N-acetyltransferase